MIRNLYNRLLWRLLIRRRATNARRGEQDVLFFQELNRQKPKREADK